MGPDYLASFRAAVANLEAHVDEVNGLNVYPVPDGDTGSNMLATMRSALAEAEAADVDSVERVAAAISFGALMGARGNSGVIASQIVRGMAEGLASKRHFNGLDLAHALSVGSHTAYAAVGRPVEGTILTVIREAAGAAVEAAEQENDLEAVLTATVDAAHAAVIRTPSLLPILREAGVVDAGGQGLLRMMQGALGYLVGSGPYVGREAERRAAAVAHGSTLVPHADEGFGYETMFLVQPHPGAVLDVDAIRMRLVEIGESVLVAGDAKAVKVHVHNERPDAVLAYGLTLGNLSRISVENLDTQAWETGERRAAEFTGVVGATAPSAPGGGIGIPEPAGRSGEPAGAEGGGPAMRGAATASVALVAPAEPPEAGRTTLTAHAVPAAGPAEAAPAEGAPTGAWTAPPQRRAEPGRGPLAIVAVAAGEGLAAVFRSFGVASVVMGGQAANPSTGELLAAIDALDAGEVLLLPNNPNVILAARQVAELARLPVRVVPTRNAAEGFAALLALDPGLGAAANSGPMLEAARAIQTLQVTEAVRDAKIAGHRVKKGQTIVLDPDDGLVASDGDRTKALLAGLASLKPGFELITLYYGDGADLAEAEGVSKLIGEWRPDIEVELIHGAQPYYRYLVAAE